MRNKPGLIARFFGRSQNTVVAKLYTHALGQPLLVHPTMGQALLGAYLDGAIDAPETVVESAGAIAVINVSGGLVNRPMPDICGAGPTSYAALRCAFDAALGDDNVKAIVFRCDSPGGMASGCFDLTDYIYENRGKKPITAQIDDMAFSGAYAIAAACDSVWVTRTGGGGSVGAYTYHVDASGANEKAGIKITYIYAGDKKVDGNPDEPLSDSARSDMQYRIDGINSLFATTIAKYRGMNVGDVIAIQAGCFNGADLVQVGFADKIGTLEDLLTSLSAPSEITDPPIGAEPGENEMPDTTIVPIVEANAESLAKVTAELAASNAKVAKLETNTAMRDAIAGLKLPVDVKLALQSSSVTDALTVATVPERVETAKKIVDLCAAAKLDSCSAGFITRGVSVEQARAELSAAVADQGTEISTTIPAKSNATANPLDPTKIYANHNTRSKAK